MRPLVTLCLEFSFVRLNCQDIFVFERSQSDVGGLVRNADIPRFAIEILLQVIADECSAVTRIDFVARNSQLIERQTDEVSLGQGRG